LACHRKSVVRSWAGHAWYDDTSCHVQLLVCRTTAPSNSNSSLLTTIRLHVCLSVSVSLSLSLSLSVCVCVCVCVCVFTRTRQDSRSLVGCCCTVTSRCSYSSLLTHTHTDTQPRTTTHTHSQRSLLQADINSETLSELVHGPPVLSSHASHYSSSLRDVLWRTIKAKFHYAIWVEAGRRPASNQLRTS